MLVSAFAIQTSPGPATCRVELLRGRVATGDRVVSLTPIERVLAFALVRCRHGAPRQQIEELVWPDALPAQAQNLFNVALCRLRKRIHSRIVVQDARGYRLGDGVDVDLWDLETAASTPLGAIDAATVAAWAADYADLDCACLRLETDADWLHAIEARLIAAARERADRFAEWSLANGYASLALRLANITLGRDPCDERACGLAIRAHVRCGDRPAAIRAYRDHERALQNDLGLAPSPELIELIRDGLRDKVAVALESARAAVAEARELCPA